MLARPHRGLAASRRYGALLAIAALIAALLAVARPGSAQAAVCSPWPTCFGAAYQVSGAPDNALGEWTYSPSDGGTEIRTIANGTTLYVGCQANNGPQEYGEWDATNVPSRTWDFGWDPGLQRYVWVYDWWMNTPEQTAANDWYSWSASSMHCNFAEGTPVAPDNVTATAVGTGTIRVTWTDTNGGLANYVVSNGNTSSADLATGTQSYYWTGLAPGQYMCFTITAKLNGLQSPWTPYACTTTWSLTPPSTITATPVGTSHVVVRWNDPTGGDADFVVDNGVTASANLAPGTTSYTWSGLLADTYMCFTVASKQSGLQSAWSAWACTTTRTYVNMGDSYSAGEGTFNYVAGTNTSTNMCHRSTDAYSGQYVAGSSRWTSVINVACTGAVTGDLFYPPGKINSQNIPTLNEKAQVSALNGNTGLVTITIGGNNLNLLGLLQNCYHQLVGPAIGACFASSINKGLFTQITQLQSTLVATYQQLQEDAPNATIVVLTYPQIFPATFDPVLDYNCNDSIVPVIIDQSQLDEIRSVVSALDTVIEQAAAQAGVRVVNMENAFSGHEVCTPIPWVNDIVGTGQDESFHPNVFGYAQEASILKSTLNSLS